MATRRDRVGAIVVAGTSSGVGKTTVAVGLMRALTRAGHVVQPFKVGPDFLDPMQHEAATGLPSVNLDGWMLGREGCIRAYHAAMAASGASIAICEGCMGLHDGRDGCSDEGSTAQIAKWLGAPVILVVDAWCLARSAAAMVHGYKTFDPDLNLAGVIFNRVAGTAHGEWIRQAMSSAPSTADVAVLGCLASDKRLAVPEKLLGLLPPPPAHPDATDGTGLHAARLAALHRLMRDHVDLEQLRRLSVLSSTPPPAPPPLRSAVARRPPVPVRIAVAKDDAFCFLYSDNLRLLQECGATIQPFSPLVDEALPADADAIYLIGGYPELHAPRLAANTAMRAAIRAFCERGGFVWAECGGLMYLAQHIVLRESDAQTAAEAAAMREGGSKPPLDGGMPSALVHSMCALLPFDVTMTARMTMGYCTATLADATASLLQLPLGTQLRCQQYHFSEATVDGEPAVQVDPKTGGGVGLRGVRQHAFDTVCMEAPGARPAPEGALLCDRTVATYCHVHLAADARLAPAFVRAARSPARQRPRACASE